MRRDSGRSLRDLSFLARNCFGRLHYIIDDVFSESIDKEIERSILSNPSTKKQKQQSNKTKLEHEGAAAISQTIAETREFAAFRSEFLRRFQSVLVNLVEHYDEEFPVTLASTSSSAAPGPLVDTLVTDHGTIVGTSYELSDLIERRHPTMTGGGSSAYNVSYGSDSETSFTNGSSGRHVSRRNSPETVRR